MLHNETVEVHNLLKLNLESDSLTLKNETYQQNNKSIENSKILFQDNINSDQLYLPSLNEVIDEPLVNLETEQDNVTLLSENSHSVSEYYPYSNENIFQDYSTLVNVAVESKQAEIEQDNSIATESKHDNDSSLINVGFESELVEIDKLILANFPYLENTSVETILPTSIVTNIEREILLQDNSALTIVNVQGNLLLAYTDEFFFLQP